MKASEVSVPYQRPIVLSSILGFALVGGHVARRHRDAGHAVRERLRVLPQRVNLGIHEPDVLQSDDVHAIRDVGDPEVLVHLENAFVILRRVVLCTE